MGSTNEQKKICLSFDVVASKSLFCAKEFSLNLDLFQISWLKQTKVITFDIATLFSHTHTLYRSFMFIFFLKINADVEMWIFLVLCKYIRTKLKALNQFDGNKREERRKKYIHIDTHTYAQHISWNIAAAVGLKRLFQWIWYFLGFFV